MKATKTLREILLNLLLLALLLCCQKSDGGTYGGVTVTSSTNFLLWTGTTNAYANTPAGIVATNTFTILPSSEYVVLTNVVSTNEIFIGSVYMQVPVLSLTNFPGWSNMLFVGSISNNFTNGLPAGGIWTTQTVPVAGTLQFPAVLQANNGIYTNGIYANP